jgi:hypothetical protein
MTEIKVSELPEVTSLDDVDLLMGVHLADGLDGSKKITVANMRSLMGSSGYTHVQAVPATVWSVIHNLGRHPSVTVVDSGGTVGWCEVLYNDANSLTITVAAAFAGTAYLN